MKVLEATAKNLRNDLNTTKDATEHKDKVIAEQNLEIDMLRKCLLISTQEERFQLDNIIMDGDETEDKKYTISMTIVDERKDQLMKIEALLRTSKVPLLL